MLDTFYTADEVAAHLKIDKRQLQNRASKHPVYRPTANLRYHAEHLKIIDKVWMGAITPEEGSAWLTLIKNRERKTLPKECEDGNG